MYGVYTRARAVRNVLGNVYLSSLTKNLWYEQREELDSGGGGTLTEALDPIIRSITILSSWFALAVILVYI